MKNACNFEIVDVESEMNVNALSEWAVLMSIYDTYSLSQDIVSDTFGLLKPKIHMLVKKI